MFTTVQEISGNIYQQYSLSLNERPFEYISQLFGICHQAQTPKAMALANQRAQKFLSEKEIIRRTRHTASYFREVPSEGLRQVLLDEEAFPLAFVHLIHDNVGIFEMFLAVMFRPTNYHCVHVDTKVS